MANFTRLKSSGNVERFDIKMHTAVVNGHQCGAEWQLCGHSGRPEILNSSGADLCLGLLGNPWFQRNF